MSLENKIVAVCIPVYNESSQISKVLDTIPDFVDHIIVVDDGSADDTKQKVKLKASSDKRIVLVIHQENQGVGAGIESGYRKSLEFSPDIVCVMAGDQQCNPNDLIKLCKPIIDGRADYTKINRLANPNFMKLVPRVRLVGNTILSLLTRFSTGYWSITDSQGGYTAAHVSVIQYLVQVGLYPRYGVPNDILSKLSYYQFKVIDVPSQPIYYVGDRSKLVPHKVAIPIFYLILRGFFKRIFFYNLFLNPTPVPFIYGLGFIMLGVGIPTSMLVVLQGVSGTVDVIDYISSLLLSLFGINLVILAVSIDISLSSLRSKN